MFQSLSTKLQLAVLAAVVLPFAGFAIFLESQIAGRMVRDFVRETLRGLAGDLAREIDARLLDREEDVLILASYGKAAWALEEAFGDDLETVGFGASDVLADPNAASRAGTEFRRGMVRDFDHYLATKPHFDLLLLVGAKGRLAVVNGRDVEGATLPEALLERLFATDFTAEAWFAPAFAGSLILQGSHVPGLLHPDGAPEGEDQDAYHNVGIAAPVRPFAESTEVVGVLYALVRWERFQELIDAPIVKDAFRGLVAAGEVPSPYAWVWDSDGDTILAHDNQALYGAQVSGERVGLPAMVEDVQDERSGAYRDYVFGGKPKMAAFHRTNRTEEGGFDWVVGVGIDKADVVAASSEARRLLSRGTLVVLLLVVLWMMVISRRTVKPILDLEAHTQAVARGDLESRVEIERSDELGRLGSAMNRMTSELARQREQLVKAEKDAAWREMARQVAHDLKNPLTPIQLSLDLYERARAENSPEQEQILERTLELVRRQVRSLREVADDFHEFTGGVAPEPERFALRELVERVFELHRAWAEESRIELVLEGDAGPVHVDPGKLERVVTNLVVNAFHAMPEGGRLEAHVAERDGRVVLTLTDSGHGLGDTVKRRLFEPYFTTKSHGTGLGLAIAARIVDEMDGSIALESEGLGRGAVARIELPRDVGEAA